MTVSRKLTRGQNALLTASLVSVLGVFFANNPTINCYFLEFFQPHERNSRASCQLKMRQIALSFEMYRQDYNGKYPLIVAGGPRNSTSEAEKGIGWGWADALQPYLKSTTCFSCWSDLAARRAFYGSTERVWYSSYWMNAHLANLSRRNVLSPATTVLLGEGSGDVDKADAAYTKSALPQTWLSDQNSPLYRHLGGANYVFADGHLKWFIAFLSVDAPNWVVMKVTNRDQRGRAIRAILCGMKKGDVAACYGVNRSTLWRWHHQLISGKGLDPKRSAGGKRAIGADREGALEAQLRAHPDATLEEHVALWQQQTGQKVSRATMGRATMGRAITRLGWSRKKRA